MRRGLVAIAFLGLLIACPGLEAQVFRWLAFGDSITLGNYDFDNEGGYPGRLHELLGCDSGDCEVFNAGKSGEKTYQAVTRITNVLADDGPFDVMMLMEGTNDIFVEYPVEASVTNLGIIANKARLAGTGTVHASIIWYHPNGQYGTTKDDEVEELRDGVEETADLTSRYFVDIWDVLCPDSHPDVHGHNQNQCFNQHYSDVCPGTPPPCGDNRGHPIGSGYTMMAEAFRNGLLAVPIPGVAVPQSPTGLINTSRPTFVWDRETPIRATWYRLVVEEDSVVVLDKWLEAATYCDLSSCTHQITVLEELANGDYLWRVQGRNPAGVGGWSADTPMTIDDQHVFADGFESGDTRAWSSQ